MSELGAASAVGMIEFHGESEMAQMARSNTLLRQTISRAESLDGELANDIHFLRAVRGARLAWELQCQFNKSDRLAATVALAGASRRVLDRSNETDARDYVPLARALRRQGDATPDVDEARAAFSSARELCELHLNDPEMRGSLAKTLSHLAVLECQEGDLSAAEQHARRAVDLHRERLSDVRMGNHGDFTSTFKAFEYLAQIVELQETYSGVRAIYDEEVRIWRRVAHKTSPPDSSALECQANSYVCLGHFEQGLGNAEAACKAFQDAERLVRDNLASFNDEYPAEAFLAGYTVALGHFDPKKFDEAGMLFGKYVHDADTRNRLLACLEVDRGAPVHSIEQLRNPFMPKRVLAAAEAIRGNKQAAIQAAREYLSDPTNDGAFGELHGLDLREVEGHLRTFLAQTGTTIDDYADLTDRGGPDVYTRTARIIQWMKRPRPPKPTVSSPPDNS